MKDQELLISEYRMRSTANVSDGLDRIGFEYLNEGLLDPIYLAAVEAVEEAVINALIAAESMFTVKPPGLICRAIDHGALCAVMRDYGRLR